MNNVPDKGFTFQKVKTIVEIIAGLFILLFVYTAISKLSNIPKFQGALFQSPLIGKMAIFIAWGLPIIELIVAALLFTQRTRMIGLFSALLLMAGFTSYLAYMIYYTPNLPCSCGGVLSQMSWKQHLVFNCCFTTLAVTALFLNKRSKKN